MEADAEIFKRRFDDSEDSHQKHFLQEEKKGGVLGEKSGM